MGPFSLNVRSINAMKIEEKPQCVKFRRLFNQVPAKLMSNFSMQSISWILVKYFQFFC